MRDNVISISVFGFLALSFTTVCEGHLLDRATSARTAGMADIGVMLPEGDGYRSNPALLAIPSERGNWQMFFSFCPDRNGTGWDSYCGGLVVRPRHDSTSEGFKIGAAVDFTGFISDEMRWLTYDYGPDYGDIYQDMGTSRWEEYIAGANVAVGWTGRTSYGFGAAVNRVRTGVWDFESDDWIFDAGAYLTTCLNVMGLGPNGNDRLILGLSVSNIGSDKSLIVNRGLDETFRIGGALELYWIDDTGRKTYVMPAIEYTDTSSFRVGLETSYRSLVYLRAGHNNDDSYSLGYTSLGVSLSTLGLRKKTVDGHDAGGALFDRIVVDLHYAYVPTRRNNVEGANFFGVAISF